LVAAGGPARLFDRARRHRTLKGHVQQAASRSRTTSSWAAVATTVIRSRKGADTVRAGWGRRSRLRRPSRRPTPESGRRPRHPPRRRWRGHRHRRPGADRLIGVTTTTSSSATPVPTPWWTNTSAPAFSEAAAARTPLPHTTAAARTPSRARATQVSTTAQPTPGTSHAAAPESDDAGTPPFARGGGASPVGNTVATIESPGSSSPGEATRVCRPERTLMPVRTRPCR
jgi:hypothetical protein